MQEIKIMGKRGSIILVVLLVLAILVTGCGSKNNASSNDSANVQPSESENDNQNINGEETPSDQAQPSGGNPPSRSDGNNGRTQKIIQDSVSAGIITQEVADKIEAYEKEQQAAKKEEMEKNADDQKKEPGKEIGMNSPIDAWVKAGFISQDQADQMKKLMPEAPVENSQQIETK